MALPQIDETPETLYRMHNASIEYRLLMTAIELKIFDYLTYAKTFEQVAEEIHGHKRNTMFFLNGLTACGLLTKKDGLYRNAPLADAFLVGDGPAYLGKALEFQQKMTGAMLENLPTLILEGPSEKSPITGAGSEKRWQTLAAVLADNARAGMAQLAADLVSELPEFPDFKKMLDLGGGPGIFGLSMVSRHPSMTGVIFDQTPVVDVAESYIKEAGMTDRVNGLAGDFNKDAIGSGYDFIWASAVLNFAGANLQPLMEKIYDALNPRGVFISFSEGLTREGTHPGGYVVSTLGGFMSSAMRPFDQGVIADAMLDSGFKSVRSRTVATCSPWQAMDMDIARK